MNSKILILITGLLIGFIIGYFIGLNQYSNEHIVISNKTVCYVDDIVIPGDKNKIIDEIYSAKKSLYIEMYMLTDKDVISAIENVYYSGVDVKIILNKDEKKDYNNNAFMTLSSIGVPVKWSSDTYKITHTKLMIIDNQTIVMGSPNFTYSGLTKNREVGIITNCIVKPYLDVFVHDWNS
ncbi:hypothetical protein J7J26_01265 [Candidatus Micrarchaeota archaeon]|nr:hypothetical protein [Candidatus Micrarchaeota archaeon]